MVYFLCKAYDSDRQNCYFALSLPVRGAWIEMCHVEGCIRDKESLPVRGAWIEITHECWTCALVGGRSPCGERGLKCMNFNFSQGFMTSLPVRGAWIEISTATLPSAESCRSPCGERGLKFCTMTIKGATLQSLPVRGAWIEIATTLRAVESGMSLPVRGAWIEISISMGGVGYRVVAPRAGSVD